MYLSNTISAPLVNINTSWNKDSNRLKKNNHFRLNSSFIALGRSLLYFWDGRRLLNPDLKISFVLFTKPSFHLFERFLEDVYF